MSLSVLILLFFVLAAVAFGIVWRNVHEQKRPKRRFKVGGGDRGRSLSIRGRRMSYTDIARARRAADPKGTSPTPPSDQRSKPPR